MITRAHAKSHHSLEVIEKKRDPNEATFRTTTEFLPFWRAVLRYRYVTDIPAIRGYTTTWVDYKRVDGHLQEVALDYAVSVCHPCATMPDFGQAAPWRPETVRRAPVLDKRQHPRPGPKYVAVGSMTMSGASRLWSALLPSRCH